MSASVSYSYERTILDGHYVNGKKVYDYDSGLRALHRFWRKGMVKRGEITVRREDMHERIHELAYENGLVDRPACLGMTDNDRMIADLHVDAGDWSMTLPDEQLPFFQQDERYEAVAAEMWGEP